MHPLTGSIGAVLIVTSLALLFRGPGPLDPSQKTNWALRIAPLSLLSGLVILALSFSLAAYKR